MVLNARVCLSVAAARTKPQLQSCMFNMKDGITGWSSAVRCDGRHTPMWAVNREPENLNTQNLNLDHFNLLRTWLEALLWFIVLVGPREHI